MKITVEYDGNKHTAFVAVDNFLRLNVNADTIKNHIQHQAFIAAFHTAPWIFEPERYSHLKPKAKKKN